MRVKKLAAQPADDLVGASVPRRVRRKQEDTEFAAARASVPAALTAFRRFPLE
jgi:hypothetical protein